MAMIVGRSRIAAGKSAVEVREEDDAEVQLAAHIRIVAAGRRVAEICEQAGGKKRQPRPVQIQLGSSEAAEAHRRKVPFSREFAETGGS